jgi:ABC-type Fe3+/spermidine/putrescine transport system ATPase subunit
VGTPSEIYERPANRFVATFVGHANLINARLTGRAQDGFAEAEAAAGLVLRGHAPPAPSSDGGVLAVMRYEKLRVRPAASPEGGVAAIIVEKTYMGSSLRFGCRTAHDALLTADTPNAAPERDLEEGDAVLLSWSHEDIVLLSS